MKNTIIALGLILAPTFTFNSLAQSPSSNNRIEKEFVSITILEKDSEFEAEAVFARQSIEPSSEVELLAKPKTSCNSLGWSIASVVGDKEKYNSTTKVLLDGELAEIPCGYGSTLAVRLIPSEDGIRAKGIFSATKGDKTVTIPFDGIFVLGESTIIYEKVENFGEFAALASEKSRTGKDEDLFTEQPSGFDEEGIGDLHSTYTMHTRSGPTDYEYNIPGNELSAILTHLKPYKRNELVGLRTSVPQFGTMIYEGKKIKILWSKSTTANTTVLFTIQGGRYMLKEPHSDDFCKLLQKYETKLSNQGMDLTLTNAF